MINISIQDLQQWSSLKKIITPHLLSVFKIDCKFKIEFQVVMKQALCLRNLISTCAYYL